MRNIFRILLCCFATLCFGQQTATVTVNTTTHVTQPPVGKLVFDGTSLFLTRGSGSPEGVVTSNPGSLYMDTTGALYIKTTGTGNTGWSIAGTGSGSVTSVAFAAPQGGFTITGSPITTSGTITATQHVADTTHDGYLSSTDWNTFNGKQNLLTIGNLTDAGTDGITVTGGTGAVIGSGTSLSQHVADSTHNGYLSSTDWSTFNGKSTVTPSALTKTDDTNVTLTLGGTPATALLQATSLTVGWTGTLANSRGGFGKAMNDPNADRLIIWDDTDNDFEFVTVGSNLTYTHSSHTLSATGGGTPGGSNTQLQYNNSGAFGGITNATSDGTNITALSLGSSVVEKWSTDLGIARNGAGIFEVNTGTAGQWGVLKAGVRDSSTTTVADGVIIGHQSTSTPTTSFGTGLLFNANDSTTADVNIGEFQFPWTTATHNSNRSDFVVKLDDGSTALAEKFRIKGNGQVVPIGTSSPPLYTVSADTTTGVDVLSGTGLRFYVSGTGRVDMQASYLGLAVNDIEFFGTLGGVASARIHYDSGTDGFFFNNDTNATTDWAPISAGRLYSSGVGDGLILAGWNSGSGATGDGVAVLFNIESTTTSDRNAGRIASLWTDGTDATRTADFRFELVNSAAALAEVFRVKASGTLALKTQSSAPSSPSEGWLYGNSTDHKIYYYNGSAFIDLTAPQDPGSGVAPTAANFTYVCGYLTGQNLKTAGNNVVIFAVPTGKRFVCESYGATVTAVTTGGSGLFNSAQVSESSGSTNLTPALTTTAGTPVVGTCYNLSNQTTSIQGSSAPQNSNVRMSWSTSNAGSTAVTGTIRVCGHYEPN